MIDLKSSSQELCEELGIPYADGGDRAEKWLRSFAAKVYRDRAAELATPCKPNANCQHPSCYAVYWGKQMLEASAKHLELTAEIESGGR